MFLILNFKMDACNSKFTMNPILKMQNVCEVIKKCFLNVYLTNKEMNTKIYLMFWLVI